MKSPSKKGRRLPIVSWREVAKALHRAGFQVIHQKGSHITFYKDDRLIVVPKHDEIKPGTLMAIIKDSGLTKERFIELLD